MSYKDLDVLQADGEVLGHEFADQVDHTLGDVFGDRYGPVPERFGGAVREVAAQDAVGQRLRQGTGRSRRRGASLWATAGTSVRTP